jgi:uncharacterized repeat protein (TIGR03803 family)
MRGNSRFLNSILFTIALIAGIALMVLLAAVPAWAQNPVPATAREAAALPEYAVKLHPATRPAMNKPRAAAGARGILGSRQSPSCPNQDSPACGGWTYENGPVNGTTDAWTINFGYIVSDTFLPGSLVQGFDFYVWEFPGDRMSSVDWSITSSPNGGTVYGSGTVSGGSLTDKFISTNQYGYDIDKVSASGLNVNVTVGSTYWFNVFNATVPSGDPVYWDENNGNGCHSTGCPSQAYASAFGTISSEPFDIVGNGSAPPPPPPCFQSGGGIQIIHDFTGQQGGNRSNGLTIDQAGNFYGTTGVGGDNDAGLAYKLSPKGQDWIFNPLYSFFPFGYPTGWDPSPVILGPDGAIYGTASGVWDDCNVGFCSLVFSLRPAPTACRTSSCSWTEGIVYQFENDGVESAANLVSGEAGNLYGTSAFGGAYGYGAIFELTPSNGGWMEKVLYSFTGFASDGAYPSSLLVGNDGNLYGTTSSGGSLDYGVVFQLVPSGGGWTESLIYTFMGERNDGYGPTSLVRDSFGNLYGVSLGYYDYLIIFMLSPSNGSWVFNALYQSPQGSTLSSDLATDTVGNVYFANGRHAYSGDNWGEVIMRPPGGNFSNLWYSSGVAFSPVGPLAIDVNGNVYGTTRDCGASDRGTVWMVKRQ